MAPSSWAPACAYAWIGASFEVKGLSWVSRHEVAQDPGWSATVTYESRSSLNMRRISHRADMGRFLADGSPIAIEVELQRKPRDILEGILEMYRRRTTGPDATLKAVIYVAGNKDVANAITRAAEKARLTKNELRVETLDWAIEQTRAHRAKKRAPDAVAEKIGAS
jgi:hypothetical protein